MPNFVIHDADGKILRTGSAPADELEKQVRAAGEKLKVAEATPFDTIDVSTGKVIKAKPVKKPEVPAYVKSRLANYPPPGELFDMLYHAMAAGEIPKATSFFDRIHAIKAAFPVGSDAVEGRVEIVVPIDKKDKVL